MRNEDVTVDMNPETLAWKGRALRAESDRDSFMRQRDDYLSIIFSMLESLTNHPEALKIASEVFAYGPGSVLRNVRSAEHAK